MGRLLFVGGSDVLSSLYGFNVLSNCGRFLGVRRERVAEGETQKINVPSLDQILKIAESYVPTVAKAEFEKKIKKLYK